MEHHEPESAGGLRSRIDALRRRLVSIQSAGPEEVVPLDHRVLRLSERVRQRHWESAHELLVDVKDPHIPASLPTPPPTGASIDISMRLERLLGEIGPLRAGFASFENSTFLARDPARRILLQRGRQLVELTQQMMKEAQSSTNQQWAMMPAWESMVKEASRSYAALARLIGRQQKRSAQVSALREFYAQLLAGNKPRLQSVSELASRILEDFDEESYPTLVEPVPFEASVVVATHATNVAHVAAYLASVDPTLRAQRSAIVIAAMFMDVGMLVSAPAVYGLARGLAVDERAAVERHPIESRLMAERVAGIEPSIVVMIASHHERLDGTGYPSGRRGDEISTGARVLAAADIYAARRSPRAHRPAQTAHAALAGTLAEADAGRLDPVRTRSLLNISLFPVGTVVELSTREIAEVVAPQSSMESEELASQPFVLVLTDRRGQPISVPMYRNLALRADTRIVRALSREESAPYRRAV